MKDFKLLDIKCNSYCKIVTICIFNIMFIYSIAVLLISIFNKDVNIMFLGVLYQGTVAGGIRFMIFVLGGLIVSIPLALLTYYPFKWILNAKGGIIVGLTLSEDILISSTPKKSRAINNKRQGLSRTENTKDEESDDEDDNDDFDDDDIL